MAIKSLKIAILLTVVMSSAGPAMAQITFGAPTSVGTGMNYYFWRLDSGSSGKTEYSQLVVPMNGFVPIKDNFEILFYAVGSTNDLDAASQQTGLTGAGDIRLQANHSFSDDHLILSFGLNMPTGKHRLDYNTDTTMLQILSRNYLEFGMRRFGQGFGANALIGGAFMMGQFRGGVGVLFEYTGDYHPYRGLGQYNPGDFVSLTAGLDRRFAGSMLFGDVTVTLYTPDQFEDRKTFKQSPESHFRVGGSYLTGQFQGNVRFSYLWRGRNTQYDSDETIEQQFQLFGNEFRAQLDLTRFFGQGWAITPSSEIKIIARNEGVGASEQGSSHYVGLGATLAKTLPGGITLSAGTKYFTGSANSGAIVIDGVQIFTGATATF